MTRDRPYRTRTLRIGVDLDNTIVCYDHLFHTLAVEQKLIPQDVAVSKTAVRNYLRVSGMEDSWTRLQAEAYGPAMRKASAFAGVAAFFRDCVRLDVEVFIVSHRTRYPYIGPAYDLHASALEWLEGYGFFDDQHIALARENVFLESTRTAKLQRIAELRCSHFIDDLPELLADADFPADTCGLLFDPEQRCPARDGIRPLASWDEAAQRMLGRRSVRS